MWMAGTGPATTRRGGGRTAQGGAGLRVPGQKNTGNDDERGLLSAIGPSTFGVA